MKLFFKPYSLRRLGCLLVAFCVALAPASALAELNIEVTDGVDVKVPIVVFPFVGEPNTKRNISRIVVANLARSGLFALLPAGQTAPPLQGSSIPAKTYEEWVARGVEKVVLGRYVAGAEDGELRFELIDTVQRRRMLAYAIKVSTQRPWEAAHIASDYIYKELTGTPGIFATRLAFVTSTRIRGKKRRFRLHISDADGYHAKEIYTTPFQIMSPTWSPDARRLAYISFERGRPELFVQDIATAKRQTYAKHTGAAISPAWSPDGRYIAYSSPGDGNYDIYILNLETLKTTRMTQGEAVDVEPAWAPDGTLFFTSDRSGRPQLYRLGSDGVAKLVTQRGDYNTDIDVSPDGKYLAYMRGSRNAFSIVVRDRKTNRETILGSKVADEGPSFTPNGQLVSHLTAHQGRTVVGLSTLDGAQRSILPLNADDLRAIAWSPLPK